MNSNLFNLDPITSLSVGDLFHVVDVSDATDSANGSDRKITAENFKNYIFNGSIARPITVLTPDGSTTGVQDATTINNALVAGDVTLMGNFYINTAIVMPSNRTLTLFNAKVLRVSDGAGATTTSSNLVVNANQNVTGDSNLTIQGVGSAVFDGQASLQTRNTTSVRFNIGLFFVKVTDLLVRGITIRTTNCFAGNMQGVINARWYGIHLDQDASTPNQDGIDIGPGCSVITIDGVTGQTGDDGFSIYAQSTSGSLHPLFQSAANGGSANTATFTNQISNITIRNVNISCPINMFRLQAGDGFKLFRCSFQNIRNRYASSRPVVQFGETSYVTTAPAIGDMYDIELDNYHGDCLALIGANSNFSNVRAKNCTITNQGNSQNALFTVFSNASFVPLCDNVVFQNISQDSISPGATSGWKLARITATTGGGVSGLVFQNISLRRCLGLWDVGVAVTNARIDGVYARVLEGDAFVSNTNSSITGFINGIRVMTKSGTPKLFAKAFAAVLGPDMPALETTDSTPTPTKGSTITCRAGKDPTGGSSTNGGLYYADGTNWVLAASLGASY